MGKLVRKLITIMMAISFVLSVVFTSGCSLKATDNATNDASEIEILYWESGLGRPFLEKIKEGFESKYPEYKIYINATSDLNSVLGGTIANGRTIGDTVDIYMGTGGSFMSVRNYLVPFDELLDTEIPGENGIKLKDKVNQSYLAGQIYEGKTLALPWMASPMSIVYNKSVFDEMGYSIPRTTNELADLAVTIISDGQSTGIMANGKKVIAPNTNKAPNPFIHAKSGYEYWGSVLDTWVAQYEGVENYSYIIEGAWYDESDGKVYSPSINAVSSRGKLEAIIALEKAIAPKDHTYYTSNSYTHTEAQTFFLNGAALMMPNGAWLENEMREHQSDFEFAMMKAPIVSGLGEKLGITDAQLAEVVSYIDSGDYKSGTTAEEKGYKKNVVDAVLSKANGTDIVARVAEARSLIYDNGGSHRMIVPEYTNNLEGVKKFLLYYYTDEAMRIYSEYTHTPAFGTYYDSSKEPSYADWSAFTKSTVEVLKDSYCLTDKKNNVFFAANSLIMSQFHESVPFDLTSPNASQKMTAKQIFKKDLTYFQNNWQTVCDILNITDSDSNFRAVPAELYN